MTQRSEDSGPGVAQLPRMLLNAVVNEDSIVVPMDKDICGVKADGQGLAACTRVARPELVGDLGCCLGQSFCLDKGVNEVDVGWPTFVRFVV